MGESIKAPNGRTTSYPLIIPPTSKPISSFESFAAQMMLLFICGGMQVTLILIIYSVYSICNQGPTIFTTVFFGLILLDYLLPIRLFYRHPIFIDSWIMEKMRGYFDMQCIIETPLDPKTRYLFAQYPHGTYPVAVVMSSMFLPQMLPEAKAFCLAATALFYYPFHRRFHSAVGGVPANRENIKKIKELDANCSVVVGGILEMFLGNSKEEIVVVRRGFIREAIRHGLDLVPIYHFGNSSLFKIFGPPWLVEALKVFARKTTIPFILFYGRLGAWIPFPQKMLMVVGSPIKVKEMKDPNTEYVEELLERFQGSLKQLYDRYRPPWESRPIRFIDEAENTWDKASKGNTKQPQLQVGSPVGTLGKLGAKAEGSKAAPR